MNKRISYKRLLETLKTEANALSRAADGVNRTADAVSGAAEQVGGAVSGAAEQVGDAAQQTARAAQDAFRVVGDQVTQVGAATQQAMGAIKQSGDRVDKSLKILTPVVAVSAGLFGAVQLGKLIKSIRGSRSRSQVELEFANRQLADQFAGKIATHKDLKPFCKIKSIQSQKVVLDVDTDYLQNNYDTFMKKVSTLQTTNAKRSVNETAMLPAFLVGIAGAAGSLVAAPIINKLTGRSGTQMSVTYQFKNSNDMNRFIEAMKDPKMVKASVAVVDENNATKTVTITADEKKVRGVFPEIEQMAKQSGAEGGDDGPAVTESTKLTLTLGQIKRLVLEYGGDWPNGDWKPERNYITKAEFEEMVANTYPWTDKRFRDDVTFLYSGEGWYPSTADELRNDISDMITARTDGSKRARLLAALEKPAEPEPEEDDDTGDDEDEPVDNEPIEIVDGED